MFYKNDTEAAILALERDRTGNYGLDCEYDEHIPDDDYEYDEEEW